jgi:hypothetical protein
MPGGTGFTNLEEYLRLNQPQGQQMASAVQQNIAQGLGSAPTKDAALAPAMQAKIQEAQARAQAADTGAGRAALLQDVYGGGANYTQGQRGLDSFLSGGAFGHEADKYAGLSHYLGPQTPHPVAGHGTKGGTAAPSPTAAGPNPAPLAPHAVQGERNDPGALYGGAGEYQSPASKLPRTAPARSGGGMTGNETPMTQGAQQDPWARLRGYMGGQYGYGSGNSQGVR